MEMRPEASICAWCGTVLQPHATAHVLRAQAVIGLPEEGEYASFELAKSGRTVTGSLATSNSLAKQAGIDVLFSTCSPACASALKAAVREEADTLGLVIS